MGVASKRRQAGSLSLPLLQVVLVATVVYPSLFHMALAVAETQGDLLPSQAGSCPEEPGRCRKGDCFSGTPGTLAKWQDPPPAEPGSSSPLEAPQSAVNASVCCDLCRTQPLCKFWQHVSTDPSIPYTTGYCYLLAQDAAPPCAPPFQPNSRLSVVGGPCNPEVNDDPHFTDGYGVTFDFNGEALKEVFCLVSDTKLHVNVLLDGYWDTRGEKREQRSWIKEVGIMWQSGSSQHSLHLVARGGPEAERGEQGYLVRARFNGQTLALPLKRKAVSSTVQRLPYVRRNLLLGSLSDPGQMNGQVNGQVNSSPLTYQGVVMRGPFEVERYTLDIPGVARMSLQLRPAHELLRTKESAHVHFNLGFLDLQVSSQVHGVLGQTFQPGRETREKLFSLLPHKEGQFPKATFQSLLKKNKSDTEASNLQGLLDGSPDEYRATGILRSDCARTRFSQPASSE